MVSVTVKVTCPLTSVVWADDGVMVELPGALGQGDRTPCDGLGTGPWSRTVTVTVEVEAPSAGSLEDEADTAELTAETAGPGRSPAACWVDGRPPL